MNKMIRLLCVLCALLLLSSASSAFAQAEDKTIYRVGDQHEVIAEAQRLLKKLDYYKGEVDGVFTQELSDAIRRFQRLNDLLETGELDSVTRAVLASNEAVAYAENTTGDMEWAIVEEAGYFTAYDALAFMPAPSSGSMWSNFMQPDFNTNEYTYFSENRFLSTRTSPLSTFAADVDTASYAQLRSLILAEKRVPVDAVRIEEMLNYFRYDYAQPTEGEPFGVTMETADCPWNAETKLLLIGLQAAEIPPEVRPQQNLVFLIDVSGSMDDPDKLPLVKRAFLLLLDQLAPTDTISIVTYASQDAVCLDGVPASQKVTIMEAINGLTAGGSTAGAAGIRTAYKLARQHFIEGGVNRILLATDGDLNVGVSDEGSLARMVSEEKESGVFLSVLGFGYGNYKDNKMEALADYGNGNYHYIDTIYEARKALVNEIGATFVTVAKDVKLQLDFNPAAIKGYRLIGYENRLMAAEDFADDTKDGGEIGSGHRVTVLYEIVPVDSEFDMGEVDSKYSATLSGNADEWLTLSIRAKAPDGNESKLYTYPLAAPQRFEAMSDNMRFAAAVVETGMRLRESEWSGSASYASALALLRDCDSVIGDPYKEEFLYLVTLLDRAEAQ